MDKLYEKPIQIRLKVTISYSKDANALESKQFAIRKARSTMQQGNHFSKPICLVILLNVKNAFNSVKWKNIFEASRVLKHENI